MSLTKVSYSMINGAYVNVLDFGADPTGVADSRAAIQAALDYAYAQGVGTSHSNQPVVYLPTGSYKITDSLILKDYVNLKGAGRGTTSIVSNFANKSALRTQYGENPVYADRTIGWNISDFTIGNALTGAGTGLAQGGSSSTIILESTASSVNDYYVGWLVKIEGGPGASQQGLITAYNGSTKTATVDVTFSPVPTSASRYRLETNTIGLNMGSTGYSFVSNMAINGYTECVYATNNGYYNTWQDVKTSGFICFWLQSDGGGNSLINCEAEFYYQGIRVDQGDFVMTGGIVESLVFDTTDGTAQAGGSSTITLAASASSVDQKWTGYQILIEGGTGAGQSRTISNYNGTTKVATVSTAWSTVPDNTSTYHIGPAAAHYCNYVGFGGSGTAALKSVNVYYETYTRTSVLGDYGATMFQCTLISPAKRGYASVLQIASPSNFIVIDFLGDYTPFTRTLSLEFANGIQGSPTASITSPGGNQLNVNNSNNTGLGYMGAAAFLPGGDYNVRWISGTGSPEGVVAASPGSLYVNLSGGTSTTLYVKTSGSGNTGWTAK